ncbi:hypothetical protein LO80_02700 [Candidatus Francisella endociliophora]|uniref:Uncharacterized protein n=1 Tax=Candidatus Francisella endociliophora TaxID=653937 RepID=A0A097ERS3_9GAMM|nr:hypothetical protein [Francisella sp. FSC1006]AIT10264.1 hypothetical protein LO80_02700 [Francisella sp. FSC1006]
MLNIIIIRGYYSKGDSVECVNVDGVKVKVTTVALGRPVFVKRKLKRIIHKYNINSGKYDLIYAISMSAGISSLIDEALYEKLHLITPFFIHHKTMRVLRKVRLRKMLGAYFLLLMNGKLGKFNEAIRVTLAEHDNIVDNGFFESTWGSVELLEGIDHTLSKEVVEDVIRKDILNLRNEVLDDKVD